MWSASDQIFLFLGEKNYWISASSKGEKSNGTVNVSEIRRSHHLGCIKPMVNTGIFATISTQQCAPSFFLGGSIFLGFFRIRGEGVAKGSEVYEGI